MQIIQIDSTIFTVSVTVTELPSEGMLSIKLHRDDENGGEHQHGSLKLSTVDDQGIVYTQMKSHDNVLSATSYSSLQQIWKY